MSGTGPFVPMFTSTNGWRYIISNDAVFMIITNADGTHDYRPTTIPVEAGLHAYNNPSEPFDFNPSQAYIDHLVAVNEQNDAQAAAAALVPPETPAAQMLATEAEKEWDYANPSPPSAPVPYVESPPSEQTRRYTRMYLGPDLALELGYEYTDIDTFHRKGYKWPSLPTAPVDHAAIAAREAARCVDSNGKPLLSFEEHVQVWMGEERRWRARKRDEEAAAAAFHAAHKDPLSLSHFKSSEDQRKRTYEESFGTSEVAAGGRVVKKVKVASGAKERARIAKSMRIRVAHDNKRKRRHEEAGLETGEGITGRKVKKLKVSSGHEETARIAARLRKREKGKGKMEDCTDEAAAANSHATAAGNDGSANKTSSTQPLRPAGDRRLQRANNVNLGRYMEKLKDRLHLD